MNRLKAELHTAQHQAAARIRQHRQSVVRAEAAEAEVAAGVVSILNMETVLLPLLARTEAALVSEKALVVELLAKIKVLEKKIDDHVEAEVGTAQEAVVVQEQLQETAAAAVEEKAAAEEAKVEAEEAKEAAVEEAKAAVEEAAAGGMSPVTVASQSHPTAPSYTDSQSSFPCSG